MKKLIPSCPYLVLLAAVIIAVLAYNIVLSAGAPDKEVIQAETSQEQPADAATSVLEPKTEEKP